MINPSAQRFFLVINKSTSKFTAYFLGKFDIASAFIAISALDRFKIRLGDFFGFYNMAGIKRLLDGINTTLAFLGVRTIYKVFEKIKIGLNARFGLGWRNGLIRLGEVKHILYFGAGG